MYRADLKDLTVKDLYSTLSSDDIAVVCFLDGGSLREPHCREFEYTSVDESYDVGRAHPYDTELRISLREDGYDESDEVAAGTISDTSATTDTLTLSGDSAEYELEYEVTDEGSTPAVEIAHDDFESSTHPGTWPELSKSDITSKLDDLVVPPGDNPYGVDQGGLGYCSNAAIAFSLAWRHPRRFLEICRAMYEGGRILSRTERHLVSDTLQHSPAAPGIDDLEWMFSSAIEDSDNWFDAVTHDDPQEGGDSDFESYWLGELAGYDNASVTEDDAGEAQVRADSNTALSNGGTAILGIDSNMVKRSQFLNNPTGKAIDSMKLNHSVTLTARFQTNTGATGNPIQYSIHTWANRVDVNSPPHPTNVVDAYLYETVTGWR